MPTVADRNNNPGNLKDPSTGTFRKFNSPQEGYAALLNDLHGKQTGTTTTGLGPSSTLVDFAKTYAPASDKNNPAQYAASIANMTGSRPDSKLSELDLGKWATAVSRMEGYTAAQKGAQNGPQTQTPPPQQNPQPQPEDHSSLLGKAINWAFPIAGDVGEDISGTSKKSALQQLGDLGLSALWFAPGVGEGAEAAIRGTGLLGEAGSKIAGQALGGAATGYGADVASKLSSGETDPGKVLTPGTGTLTGGILGGAVGKLASKYGQEGVLRDTASSNNSVFGQWKGSANDLGESFAKGNDPGKLAAQKGLNLSSMYDPETVAYKTKDAAASAIKDAATLDQTLTETLKRTPGGSTATEMEQAAMQKAVANAPDKITAAERASEVKSFFDKVRQTYGENITLADMNEIKGRAWTESVFDGVKTNTQRKAARIVGRTLKTSIEDIAKKNGVEGVDEMNKYIGSHYDLADILSGIHGNKAKGGRIGDILTKHTGGAIGAGIGTVFGGGPVGSILGFLAGEWGGGKAASVMRRIGSAPLRNALLKRIVAEDPEIVQKFMQYAKQTPKGLEALQEQLGGQGIPFMEPKDIKGVPVKTPKKSSGILGNLITAASAKAAAQ